MAEPCQYKAMGLVPRIAVVTMMMMTATMINKSHDYISFQNLAFLSLIISEL